MMILLAAALLYLTAFLPAQALAQKVETVPYGDFESWTVRHITESSIIGGQVQTLYVVGPEETIDSNAPYDYKRTIWSSSNALARVSGVTKTSVTMEPDEGPTGTCAKLTTRFATCKVAGMLNIKVLATGALYWGRLLEPVTSTKNAYANIDWGIPFTRHPSALILDFKTEMPCTGMLTKGTTFRQTEFPGEDPCQIMLLLQKRWEDENGDIHALRVGTAFLRIDKSTGAWRKDTRIPVIYGDASQSPGFKPYMGMQKGEKTLYAVNSRGQRKPIIEEGWAEPGTQCTHAIFQITAGCQGAFTGALGNTIWVDNVRLEHQ